MKSLGVRIRIDFGPNRALGPGKIALLEQMGRVGSLSKAARELGMSYRRAWLLLQSLNELLDEPVAVATKGGAGGGGVKLTVTGKALIHAYRQLESTLAKQAGRYLGRFASSRRALGPDVASTKRLSKARHVSKKLTTF
jgi:molybdate transport system regulatory protein